MTRQPAKGWLPYRGQIPNELNPAARLTGSWCFDPGWRRVVTDDRISHLDGTHSDGQAHITLAEDHYVGVALIETAEQPLRVLVHHFTLATALPALFQAT